MNTNTDTEAKITEKSCSCESAHFAAMLAKKLKTLLCLPALLKTLSLMGAIFTSNKAVMLLVCPFACEKIQQVITRFSQNFFWTGCTWSKRKLSTLLVLETIQDSLRLEDMT